MAENFVDLCREYVDIMRGNCRLYEYALHGAVLTEWEGNNLAKEALRQKEEIEGRIRAKLRNPHIPDEDKEEGAKLILDYEEERKKWWEAYRNDTCD